MSPRPEGDGAIFMFQALAARAAVFSREAESIGGFVQIVDGRFSPLFNGGRAMTALSEFILARLSEDEAVAREVEAERRRTADALDLPASRQDRSCRADYDGAGPSVTLGAHRLLVEVASKRRLVGLHGGDPCDACEWYALTGDRYEGTCPTLRILALPYADHPDYQTEWRP